MPLIKKSAYPGPPFYLFNGHLQTIIPALGKAAKVDYTRERLITPDEDFLDLDRIKTGSKNLVILTHGLEGNSSRNYMQNAAKWFSDRAWDVVAWNCRSCSGEMNKAKRLYSHGEIDDIGAVIDYALDTDNYENIALVGYSMGGNITMKYLGVNGENVPPQVKAGVAFSSPTDLKASTVKTEQRQNKIYNKRFLKSLEGKMRLKAEQYPELIDARNFAKVKNWDDFMRIFYTPLHDMKDIEAFYHYASSRNFVAGTTVPILLVNALNDPLLTDECHPVDIAEGHPLFYVELPEKGGHCGFPLPGSLHGWAEMRAWEFISEKIKKT